MFKTIFYSTTLSFYIFFFFFLALDVFSWMVLHAPKWLFFKGLCLANRNGWNPVFVSNIEHGLTGP